MHIDTLMTSKRPFLTDGGLETYMIFDEGLDLPEFASFTLLDTERGQQALRDYFARFIGLADRAETGFVLDTATWRANVPWGRKMGLDEAAVSAINVAAAAFAADMRDSFAAEGLPIVINGVVGPSDDGYSPASQLSAEEARAIHAPQIKALAGAGVDMISAITMTHSGEALGVALAARDADMPVVISFTLETDGRLPSGETLAEAIERVDAATGGYPLYFMINCAHPDHFSGILPGSAVLERIGGIRANASRMSHAELDVAEELDPGNPEELGDQYAELMALLPSLRVLGGCCGTDHKHVGCIAGHVH